MGTLLREFTFGYARQLDSVLAEHLAGLCDRVNLLPGAQARASIEHPGRGDAAERRRKGRDLRTRRDSSMW